MAAETYASLLNECLTMILPEAQAEITMMDQLNNYVVSQGILKQVASIMSTFKSGQSLKLNVF
jgi:hypothetical protein